MRLLEHQAKDLLSAYGVPFPERVLVFGDIRENVFPALRAIRGRPSSVPC